MLVLISRAKIALRAILARVQSQRRHVSRYYSAGGTTIHGATYFDDACQPARQGFSWARGQYQQPSTAPLSAVDRRNRETLGKLYTDSMFLMFLLK